MSLILPDDLERAAADYASLVALDRLEEAGPQAEPARTKADFFREVGYVPLPVQQEFHDLPAFALGGPWDALYGGAAGPGKTVALFMDGLGWAYSVPRMELWYIRGSYGELADSFVPLIEDYDRFMHLGWRWNSTRMILRLPNRSVVRFRYAADAKAAGKVRSAQCQGLYVDERTTLNPDVVDRFAVRVRSGKGSVPVVGIRSASNPSGIGHADVKTRFIDPAPLGRERITFTLKRTGRSSYRYFIPGLPDDNPHLGPDYYDTLELLPPKIRHAYLTGDWNYAEGLAFSGEWDPLVHVVKPGTFDIPEDAIRAVGVDYGHDAPFCALWGAKFGDRTVVVYRELYQNNLTPEQQADAILAVERPFERPTPRALPTALDRSCWAREPHSPAPVGNLPPKGSIADLYRQRGVHVVRSISDRKSGKAMVHSGLRIRADGRPRLYIQENCTNLIRTLPALPVSQSDPEDVDTGAEDHAYDALRYLLQVLVPARPARVRTGAAVAVATSAAPQGART